MGPGPFCNVERFAIGNGSCRRAVLGAMPAFHPSVSDIGLILALVLLIITAAFCLVRRSPLSPAVEILRRIALFYLAIFKRFTVVDAERIPETGPLIIVANHTSSFDPVCVQSACERRLVRFMQAREFYEQWPFIFLFKLLRVIPVNRTGNDTASIRTALRTLDAGGCIGIFPEGRISDDGQIHEARKGAALLALMSNAAVVPAYIHGTGRFAGMVRDFFRLDRVTIFFGEPIRFDDLAGRQREEAVRDMALKRIMKGIIDLRDASAAPAARPSGLSADVR